MGDAYLIPVYMFFAGLGLVAAVLPVFVALWVAVVVTEWLTAKYPEQKVKR